MVHESVRLCVCLFVRVRVSMCGCVLVCVLVHCFLQGGCVHKCSFYVRESVSVNPLHFGSSVGRNTSLLSSGVAIVLGVPPKHTNTMQEQFYEEDRQHMK